MAQEERGRRDRAAHWLLHTRGYRVQNRGQFLKEQLCFSRRCIPLYPGERNLHLLSINVTKGKIRSPFGPLSKYFGSPFKLGTVVSVSLTVSRKTPIFFSFCRSGILWGLCSVHKNGAGRKYPLAIGCLYRPLCLVDKSTNLVQIRNILQGYL